MNKTFRIIYVVFTFLLIILPYAKLTNTNYLSTWEYIFYYTGLDIFLYISPLIVLNILKLERFKKKGYLGVSIALTILSSFYFLLSLIWIFSSVEYYIPHVGIYLLLAILPLNLISIFYDKKNNNFDI